MIQRIQSIYLLCVVVFLMVFMLADFNISGGNERQNQQIYFFQTTQKTTFSSPTPSEVFNTGLIVSFSIAALLAFITIFQFKNLKLQKRLTKLNFIPLFAGAFFIFFTHFKTIGSIHGMWESHFSYPIIILFLTYLFNFLALTGISKDLRTLASVDRLR